MLAAASRDAAGGSAHSVVAAVVRRDEAGRVLVVRKRGTSRYMLPGGKIEPDHVVHGHIYEHPVVPDLSVRAEIEELLWLRLSDMPGGDDLAPLLVTRVLPALERRQPTGR